ncbi:hypothetical protein JCM8547_007318 [Rhodosporidiobolus lusitaniae]
MSNTIVLESPTSPAEYSAYRQVSTSSSSSRRSTSLFWLLATIVAALALVAYTAFPPLFLTSFSAPVVYGPPERVITIKELERNVVPESAWVAIDGQVWDVTNTISRHPPGPNYIIRQVGSDISELFHKHHHREGLLAMLENQPDRIKRVGVLEKKEDETDFAWLGWIRWK